ncbi:MAG: hypothetical protein K2N95_03095 [Lachnospiraceae bacterium]|nr:hypothetical protein [Lachnospiraceae bacterium]
MKKGAISLISLLSGAVIGAGAIGKAVIGETEKAKSMSDKHLALFLMMNQWVKVKQEGKNLSDYFEKNGYKKIAIYGMSYAGVTLFEELKGTKTKVAYGIDINADNIYSDLDIFSVEDDLPGVDAIVVTAITFFDEIEEQLSKKRDCPILSLEDILYDI